MSLCPQTQTDDDAPVVPRGQGRGSSDGAHVRGGGVRVRGGRGGGRGGCRGRGDAQAHPQARGQTRGRRGRGQRGWGLGRGQGQPAQQPGPVWQDDVNEVPDWLPDLAFQNPGRPSIDCADFQPVDFSLATFSDELIIIIRDETNQYFHQWWQAKEDDEYSGQEV